MTFNDYVNRKISLKLNLWYSKGKSTSGVINDAVVNKLSAKVNNYGKYYIITKMSFPVDIVSEEYAYNRSNAIEINFTTDEFRDRKLVSILK